MTLREKQYYDEWEPYFEALARIRSTVEDSLSYWKKRIDVESLKEGEVTIDWITHFLIERDAEVRPEIESLIRTMLEDIKDEK